MPDAVDATVSDMMLRHQVYLEGVKRGAANDYSKITSDLAAELRNLFARVTDANLSDLNQRDFNKFIARLRASISDVFQSNGRTFLRDTRKLVDIERQIFQQIFKANTGTVVRSPTTSQLWGGIRNSTIPANGATFDQTLTGIRNSTVSLIERSIRSGYVDKLPTSDILKRVIGVQSKNFEDGLLRRVSSWAGSLADTTVTHASATVNHELASNYYDEYQWVSVLDDGTTDICEDRDGNIYVYGEGPIPPAHYGCRSDIVPVTDDDVPDSFAGWLEQQPFKFLDDVFKAGDASLDNVKVISLDSLRGKTEFILI